jgi:uncharacterized protein YoxC
MQIAKMFGSLGFKVDLSGLQQFREEMNKARMQIRGFASDAKGLEKNVKTLTSEVAKLKKSLKLSVDTKGVKKGFENVEKAVASTASSFLKFESSSLKLTGSITNIDDKIQSSIPKWERYRSEVEATARALGSLRGGNIPNMRGGSGTTSSTVSQRASTQKEVNPSALYLGGLAGGGLFNTARQSIIGGLATAIPFALGGVTKSVISKGRAYQSSDQVLLAHSTSESDYKNNRKYLDNLVKETGIDITEATSGFGRVLNASRAGGGNREQAQNVFEAFAKYGTTMHLSLDENKRMIKAVEQIYTNQRILGGEINQFANVGIPMKAILKEISNGNLGGNSKEVVPEEIKKLAGSKAPSTVELAPYLAKYMLNTAYNNGAFEKAQQSSQKKQGDFENAWTNFSKDIMHNGGDKALASFFTMLTNVVEAVNNLTTALNKINDVFASLSKSLTGDSGWSKFLWIILALLVPIGRVGKGVSLLGRSFGFLRNSLDKVALAFASVRSVGGLVATFAGLFKWVWRLAGRWFILIGAMQLFIKLGEKIRENNHSTQITWLDVFTQKLLLARENISLLKYELKNLYGGSYDGKGEKVPQFSNQGIPINTSNMLGLTEEDLNNQEKNYFRKQDILNSMPRSVEKSRWDNGQKQGSVTKLTIKNAFNVDGKMLQTDTTEHYINFGTDGHVSPYKVGHKQ